MKQLKVKEAIFSVYSQKKEQKACTESRKHSEFESRKTFVTRDFKSRRPSAENA